MPKGYNGKVLRVDLTSGAIRLEEPPEIVYRTYLGVLAANRYVRC